MSHRAVIRSPRRSGFSLVELLVSLGIILVLVSMLLPTVGRLREVSRRATCGSNLRQLALAAIAYAADDDDASFIPRNPADLNADDDFTLWYPKYIRDGRVFVCPSTANQVLQLPNHLRSNAPGGAQDASGGHSYELRNWYAGGYTFPDGVTIPPSARAPTDIVIKRLRGGPAVRSGRIILITDADEGGPNDSNNWPDAMNDNHGRDGFNASFMDGHAEWLPTGKVILQAYMDGYYNPSVSGSIMTQYGLQLNGKTYSWR